MTAGTKPREYYRDQHGLHPIFEEDFHTKTELTSAADSDELLIWDATDEIYKRITLANLKSYLGL